jgi:hypothetical protein
MSPQALPEDSFNIHIIVSIKEEFLLHKKSFINFGTVKVVWSKLGPAVANSYTHIKV